MDDLARRAVTCKGWRWMPGMRLRSADGEHTRVGAVLSDGGLLVEWESCCGSKTWHAPDARREFLPDLIDPATLGCLLALVREAHGSPLLGVLPCYVSGGGVIWQTDHPYPDACPFAGTHATSTAALVAALEAAP